MPLKKHYDYEQLVQPNILKHLFPEYLSDKIKEAGHLLISGDIEDFYKGLTIIDEVSNGRVSLTKAALQIWQTDPLIGIGANNFKKIGIQETDVLEYWADLLYRFFIISSLNLTATKHSFNHLSG